MLKKCLFCKSVHNNKMFCSKICHLTFRNKSNKSRKNISKLNSGKNNGMWKGISASYSAKHQWIRRKFGTPNLCEKCKTKKSKKYEWANISGRYKRNRKDWKRLCASCHDKYDGVQYKLWKTIRRR